MYVICVQLIFQIAVHVHPNIFKLESVCLIASVYEVCVCIINGGLAQMRLTSFILICVSTAACEFELDAILSNAVFFSVKIFSQLFDAKDRSWCSYFYCEKYNPSEHWIISIFWLLQTPYRTFYKRDISPPATLNNSQLGYGTMYSFHWYVIRARMSVAPLAW